MSDDYVREQLHRNHGAVFPYLGSKRMTKIQICYSKDSYTILGGKKCVKYVAA